MSAYTAPSFSAANGAVPSVPGKVPIAPLGQPPFRPNDRIIRSYRRSRSGCFTCRLRRKKCDEVRPSCDTCIKLGIKCEYKIPHWWSTGEKRRRQKERIKHRIRQTKVMEKHGCLREYMNRIRALAERSPQMSIQESNRPMMGEEYNWAPPMVSPVTPYSVDVTSETFVSPGVSPSFPTGSPSSLHFTPVNQSQAPMLSPMPMQQAVPMSPQAALPQEPVQMGPQMSTQPVQMHGTPMHGLPTHGLPMHGAQMHGTQVHDTQVQMHGTPMHGTQMHGTQMHDNQVHGVQMPGQVHDALLHGAPMPTEMLTQMATQVAPQAPAELSTQMAQPAQASTEVATPQLTNMTPNQIAAQLPFQVRPQMPIIMPVQVSTPRLPTDVWFGNNNVSMSHNSFGQPQHCSAMDVPGFAFPQGSFQVPLHTILPLDKKDTPYLDHFMDNVLQLAFPIVDLYQAGQFRLKEIVNIMQYNRSYMHCCLSASVTHMKTSQGLEDEMDHDIMQHRYEAIAQLCSALSRGHNPMLVIDATLSMIYYHCKMSNSDDYLPDIPWSTHLQGVATLVKKLERSPSQFNISLITWIDILGATMKGTTPHFAHAYRTKHLKGSLSGLRGLMGCEDRVMYLIAEIACLEHLWVDGIVDDLEMNGHIAALRKQIDWSEPADQTLSHPYTPSGAIMPMHLTNSITALFRIAARLYLNSLLPGFDRFDFTAKDLVSAAADALDFIPDGRNGYDRCIVWPLFIVGAYSTPACSFRRVLTQRIAAMGYLGNFASFGRMYRLLREIWRIAEGPMAVVSDESDEADEADEANEEDAPGSPESVDSNATIRPPAPVPVRENLHWREVMKRNDWDFLLL